MLSLPPEQQVRLSAPGCPICDMVEDYRSARQVLENTPAIQFTPEHIGHLQLIEQLLASLTKEDSQCFSVEPLRRPMWQTIRQGATAALLSFGWQDATVQPFVGDSTGVWVRPPSAEDST